MTAPEPQSPLGFTGEDVLGLLVELVSVDPGEMGTVLDLWLPAYAPTKRAAFTFLWAFVDAVVTAAGVGGGERFAALQVGPGCPTSIRTVGQLLTTTINQDLDTKSAVLHTLLAGDPDVVSEVVAELAVVFRRMYDARVAAGQ